MPIEITIGDTIHRRAYSLSAGPKPNVLRITVKREDRGTVSRFLHDTFKPGDVLRARTPAGTFTLRQGTARPTVFLSAGVGITPMMAMTEALLKTFPATRTLFIHGARARNTIPFLAQLMDWQKIHKGFELNLALSAPDESAKPERIDEDYLSRIDIPVDGDFYLCGPTGFMEDLYSALTRLGVDDRHIHVEAFGPSSLSNNHRAKNKRLSFKKQVPVTFRKSNKTALWSPDRDSLLALAEANGIDAAFSCRSGNCGSCAVTFSAGKINHEHTAFVTDNDELLTCCALPAADDGTPIEIDL